MEPVVEARHLTRSFDALNAVDDLDLTVFRGEIFGLVGPDGAGKTTTLRLLCGLMDPSSGGIRILGRDVGREHEQVKNRIGYMAQRFGLYGDLTVDENMNFYADLFGIPDRQRAELTPELLRMTRLAPFRDRPAAKLSGGMKQKLALMCTLLHRPEILFLDEPTNGVDPVSRRELWTILYQLVKDGITIFITTAYLDEAERCTRVALMHKGRLIRCDTPDALRRSMPEACYEVRAEQQQAARQYLEGRAGVYSVHPFGAALHVLVDAGSTEPEQWPGALGAISVKRVTPSLEDAFIGLLRGGDRPAAGA